MEINQSLLLVDVMTISNIIYNIYYNIINNKYIRRLVDYLIDTLVTNIVIMVIIVPWYYFNGMSKEGLEMVIKAFFTIGWVEAFPIPIVLRWVRRRIRYLEVKV